MNSMNLFLKGFLRGLGYVVAYGVLVAIGHYLQMSTVLSASVSGAIVALVIGPAEHWLTTQDPTDLGSVAAQ